MTQVERLVKIYLDSMARLQAEVKRRQTWGLSTHYQDALLRAIDRELKTLNLETYAWADSAIQQAYQRGAKLAWQAAHTADRNIKAFSAFGGLNKRAAELLAHNTQDFLRITNSLIARQAKDTVRKVGVEVTAKKFAETLTVRETRKLMETRLAEEGFFAQVPWRNGRGSMRTDSYAELVARTTTAEATNTGTLNQMREMGKVLVKMTEHNTTCKVCASRQGRVYRTVEVDELPENDPRRQFPHIREGMPRWPTYKTVHPNCAHRLLPYIWDQKTEEEQHEALKDADQPFNHDPRGETERLRYEKVQRENAERLRDRKQWEQYKARLGDEAPKTLSGFRRMKAANSERWQELQEGYRSRLYTMDADDIIKTQGRLSNEATRRWYKTHDATISDQIDRTQPIKAQAEQAFSLRNQYRAQARKLMADRALAAELERDDPNLTFEELLAHKRDKYGLVGEDAYKDIIRSASTTRKSVDQEMGLEDEQK